MNICLFAPEEIGKPLSELDSRAVHIKKILKKKEGDTFEAGVIGGAAGIATITKIVESDTGSGTSKAGGGKASDNPDKTSDSAKTGSVWFSFEPRSDGKPLFDLHMIVGFPRPIQLKRLLRDAAALGIKSVSLAGTQLGEKSYLKSSLARTEEIHKMLYEGTVQAGGTHIPQNRVFETLYDCLKNFAELNWLLEDGGKEKRAEQRCVKIALDTNAQTSLADFLSLPTANSPLPNNAPPLKGKTVFVAIGSERGWTDGERSLLEKNGFARLGMGERTMRTETAATVGASLVLSAMGHLR